ncbi:ArsR/SmtB family transcription factor [Chitinophaga solisilvae]|uniref:ArsR/SmtB family transcription factor n=1 Tax=Chitinophaga solisilvae TaxID=1233460 RepID=UPI00136BD006|nr:metalloregulator ArsR/SmtB family transcription factor [Chitinophaga solisilvae]
MKTNARILKDRIYEELAITAKAMGNPRRMEIIDLLAQGPFPVEAIAKYTGMSIANTSQHLQVLKNARLAEITRKGNFIYYQLAGQHVFSAWSALRELGVTYNAEAKKLVEDYQEQQQQQGISAEELLKKAKAGKVVILDIRPEEEYQRGHIHRAISIPLDELENRIRELSKKQEIVAYCRGTLCMLVNHAVELLAKKGYKVKKFDKGYQDWTMKGYPVDMASRP